MAYQPTLKPAFLDDLIVLPKAEQKKVSRAVEQITRQPFGGNSKKIFKDAYKNLYRYRVGDYRIAYAVGTGCVSLLAVGARKDIYDRLRGASGLGPVPEVEAVEPEPVAIRTVPDDPIPPKLADGRDRPDPEEVASDGASGQQDPDLLGALLELWDVEERYRKAILGCSTPEEILDLDLPEQILEKVLHIQSPPSVAQRVEQPSLELAAPQDLDHFLDGTLSGFLLRLDSDQQRAASRNTRGPVLVKGGAGSGKSVVALYRIRNLFAEQAQESLFGNRPPKVLLLTYTRALTNASRQLLGRLVTEPAARGIEVRTLDSLASSLIASTERVNREEEKRILQEVRETIRFPGGPLEARACERAVARLDDDYLLTEFEWVLDGRPIPDLDKYLAAERKGRGTRLDRAGRTAVWHVYLEWRERLSLPTYVQGQVQALIRAIEVDEKEKYDVVVVDEAQDLKPVGILLALSMCRSPAGFYLTADEKQSIYGRGYSWKQVSEDLKLSGRTTVLRRTTGAPLRSQPPPNSSSTRGVSGSKRSARRPCTRGPGPSASSAGAASRSPSRSSSEAGPWSSAYPSGREQSWSAWGGTARRSRRSSGARGSRPAGSNRRTSISTRAS